MFGAGARQQTDPGAEFTELRLKVLPAGIDVGDVRHGADLLKLGTNVDEVQENLALVGPVGHSDAATFGILELDEQAMQIIQFS